MVEIAQTRRLHPRHGVHDQRAQTPDRAPDSVRRTIWIDSFRFDGAAGPTTMLGSGRDLFTPATGEPRVLATADVEVVLAPLHGVVAEVRKPAGYDALVGAAVPAGWRRALHPLIPADERNGLTHRILDDFPGAFLGAGIPVVEAGVYPYQPKELLFLLNVCRGWSAGGTQEVDINAGRFPKPTGPSPTDISRPDDPWAWHVTDTPRADLTRRSRRFDVRREGDDLVIDAHFRDVWLPVAGEPEVVHEYSLAARADGASFEVTAVQVDAHTLPWDDCNSVTDSGQHLLGATLGNLETPVRTRLSGVAGCTHLNDTFRGLDAVPLLAAALDQEVR